MAAVYVQEFSGFPLRRTDFDPPARALFLEIRHPANDLPVEEALYRTCNAGSSPPLTSMGCPDLAEEASPTTLKTVTAFSRRQRRADGNSADIRELVENKGVLGRL